jgi:hypothetical protein
MIKIKRIYAGIVAVAAHWRQPFIDRRGFFAFSRPEFLAENNGKSNRELRFEFTHSGGG